MIVAKTDNNRCITGAKVYKNNCINNINNLAKLTGLTTFKQWDIILVNCPVKFWIANNINNLTKLK